jgi:hypothetical protein
MPVEVPEAKPPNPSASSHSRVETGKVVMVLGYVSGLGGLNLLTLAAKRA